MIKQKNILLIVAIAIFVIFSVFYFVSVNQMSYAFVYNAEEEKYETRMNYIKIAAENYAKLHDDKFEEDTLYVTVDELIKDNLLIADDEKGNYNDPTSSVKTFNDIKVRVEKSGKDTYKTKILK